MKTPACFQTALLSSVLAFASMAQAEIRTFTSTDGRTLDAEVIAATPDTVTLKMASGQTIAAQITKFSSADQEYLITWRKEHPVAIKYGFATSYTKSKTKSSKSNQGSKTVTTESWVCNMKIANRSGQTLEDVKVKYDIFCEQGGVLRKTSGIAQVGTIKNLQEMIIPTGEVELTVTQLKGGYYYIDGSRSRNKDDLVGMTIVVQHEGKSVFSWSSSGVPAGASNTEGKGGSLFGK